jgi:hypothetical protein
MAGAGLFGYRATASTIFSVNHKTQTNMLQHNVYFWLKDGVNQQDRERFEQGLTTLVESISEVQNAQIGRPAATEARGVVDSSFHYSLFVWFASIEDHDVYQTHAAHNEFIEKYAALWDSVKVYDSDLFA